MHDKQLIVIVGAARSGTKLVRDLLGLQPGISTVPYDLPFVWLDGHAAVGHDEISPSAASARARARVEERLARFAHSPVLVEKTVGNALRVPYVDALFPAARFIHLVRDGVDTVESAYRQWTGKPDWRYLARKLRDLRGVVPPSYALRQFQHAIVRYARGQRRAPVWGPRYAGIADDASRFGALYASAMQWRRCVESASTGLADIFEDRQIQVRYEDLVAAPEVELGRLAAFCGFGKDIVLPRGHITSSNIEKGWTRLSNDDLKTVRSLIEPAQRRLGYRP